MTQALRDLLPLLIPGLALTAIGVHLTWSFGRDLHFGRASRHWREAQGRVVDQDAYVASLPRGGSVRQAAFTYTYRVNGVEYTSNRYDFAGRNATLGLGSALPEHSVGEHVAVWYDPFEPRRAVLVQGVLFGNYLRMLVATAFLFFGLLLLGATNDVDRSLSTTHGRIDSTKARMLTSAELDSLRRLPTIVDTFIAKTTHLELKVGDTLRLSSLRVEARDSAGHVLHGAMMTFRIPPSAIIRGFGPGFEAVAPGHASLLIEDRPRDLSIDSTPRRPSTRIEIDVRR
jgi:hypothetical protein